MEAVVSRLEAINYRVVSTEAPKRKRKGGGKAARTHASKSSYSEGGKLK